MSKPGDFLRSVVVQESVTFEAFQVTLDNYELVAKRIESSEFVLTMKSLSTGEKITEIEYTLREPDDTRPIARTYKLTIEPGAYLVRYHTKHGRWRATANNPEEIRQEGYSLKRISELYYDADEYLTSAPYDR